MLTVFQKRTVARLPLILPWQATLFLVVTHAAGVIGLLAPSSRPLFQWATPFHLLLSVVLLLYFHRDWRASFWIFVIAVMMLGYWVEVLGVHTSLIFGDYAYDTTLGVKVLEVPLMIAVNWLLLTYVCGSVCNHLLTRTIYKIVLAAILMVGLDYFIEPVAIAYDFWHWTAVTPPLHNYIGWFLVALLAQSLFFGLSFGKSNPLATAVLVIQLLFFAVLQYW